MHAPGDSLSGLDLEGLRVQLASFAAERGWEKFHTPRNLLLALVGEVGELSELFQWRGDEDARPGLPGWDDVAKTRVGDELADVLLYLIRLADACEIDLSQAVAAKLQKNATKYPVQKCFGSSAKYTTFQ